MVIIMTVSAADSPLLQTVRRYLEERGLEIVPAPEPFTFLARHPNNPTVGTGIRVVPDLNHFSLTEMEKLTAASGAAGINRLMVFADGDFPADISQKAVQLCISLIDRRELQTCLPTPSRPTPPPLPVGHHVAGSPQNGFHPSQSVPILTAVDSRPARPKVKRSWLSQFCGLILTVVVGLSVVDRWRTIVAEKASSPVTQNASHSLPITENTPTFASSRAAGSTAHFRKLYGIDAVDNPGLRALAEDFVMVHEKRLPRIYLDQHKAALDDHASELHRFPGLAALITIQIPDRKMRLQAYDSLISRLETHGDPVLLYRARTEKAALSDSPADAEAAMVSFEAMVKSFDQNVDYSHHLEDVMGTHGEFHLEKDPQRVFRAINANPHFPFWLHGLITATFHVDLAWKARGNGYADTVSEENWKIFHSHLAVAEKNLRESWKSYPHHPIAATRMISISNWKGADADETKDWFGKALSVRADYDLAYDAYAYSLMSRWGGSDAALLDLGKSCLDPRLHGTNVPLKLLLTHRLLSRDSSQLSDHWSKLRRAEKSEITGMLDGVLASNSHPAHQRYYLSLKSAVCYLIGETSDTKRIVNELGKDLDPCAFRHLPVSERHLRDLATGKGYSADELPGIPIELTEG